MGIMREAFYIFYGFILLLQGLFYSILLNFVELKIKNPDPILTVKRIEWRKFIYYFCLSIETERYGVGKKNVYFFHIGYVTTP